MSANKFLNLINNRFKFNLFLFSKLPSAFFSGVRVKAIDETKAVVSVPYKWFSQNPFRSTYFACLAMAAEMTTGVPGLMNIYKRKPGVSMLVVKLEALYFKKAISRTYFTCADVNKIEQAVEKAIATGVAQTVVATSTGNDKEGNKIAEFYITWSFKAKTG